MALSSTPSSDGALPASWASRRSITTAPPHWSRTVTSSQPPRRNGSRARSSTRTIRAGPSTIAFAAAGTRLDDVDFVVFYDKPFIKFERLLETYLTMSPQGFTSFRMALPLWLREKLFQKKSLLADELKEVAPEFDWHNRLTFCEHHLSHAARVLPSPFDRAAISRSTASASGARPRPGRRRGQPKLRIDRRSASRTRWACSTRRSPTTAASRSTAANTS